MPVAVGAAGSKAARTASEVGGALAGVEAGTAFFVEALALEDFLAEADLVELLLDFVLELLLDGLEDFLAELDLLELLVVAGLLFADFVGGLVVVSSVAARTDAGSAMQQAIVARSATTRRTVRPRMGIASANRTGCARVNAPAVWIPLANPCVAGWSMCGSVVVRALRPVVTPARRRLQSRRLAPGRKSFRTACDRPRSPHRRQRTSRNSPG